MSPCHLTTRRGKSATPYFVQADPKLDLPLALLHGATERQVGLVRVQVDVVARADPHPRPHLWKDTRTGPCQEARGMPAFTIPLGCANHPQPASLSCPARPFPGPLQLRIYVLRASYRRAVGERRVPEDRGHDGRPHGARHGRLHEAGGGGRQKRCRIDARRGSRRRCRRCVSVRIRCIVGVSHAQRHWDPSSAQPRGIAAFRQFRPTPSVVLSLSRSLGRSPVRSLDQSVGRDVRPPPSVWVST